MCDGLCLYEINLFSKGRRWGNILEFPFLLQNENSCQGLFTNRISNSCKKHKRQRITINNNINDKDVYYGQDWIP